MPMKKIYVKIKYFLDFIIALILLVLFSPLFIGISIAIKAEDGGKIFFSQLRTGKYGKKFKCYKFRSMVGTDLAFDKKSPVVQDGDMRLTKTGRILRKFKLDELPQLLNVIKGDMCFIAPRPLLPVYDTDYEDWELVKFEMRPGLTGLGQVNGNGHLPLKDRKFYDVYYVVHVSPLLDAVIFFKTIGVILLGEERFTHYVSLKQYIMLKREILKNYIPNQKICRHLNRAPSRLKK